MGRDSWTSGPGPATGSPLDFDPVLPGTTHAIRLPSALVEREFELRQIEALIGATGDGRGGALLVEGAAGIGKTALLDAAAARAGRRGVCVLVGRGRELERGFALGLMRQCLLPVLREATPQLRAELLDGAAGLAGAALLDVPAAGPAPAAFGILHGLYWLTSNLAVTGPLLLVVDDAHWGDEASLQALAFLARRAESLPLAIIVAARDVDEPGLWGLRSDPVTTLLRPQPLSTTAVADVLGGAEPAFAAACHHATGGNPFLLDQLAAALRDGRVEQTDAEAGRVAEITPPDLVRGVRHQLAVLGAPVTAVAEAIAVLDADADPARVAALTGLASTEVELLADDLAAAGLLAGEPPLRFRHPLLLEAVHGAMGPGARAAAHRRAAALLEDGMRRALHLLEVPAESDPDVVATLREAALDARARGAPDAAARLLSRAVAEPPPTAVRPAVLIELVEALHAQGDSATAARRAREAHSCAPDPVSRARVLALWGTVIGPDLAAMAELGPLAERARAEVGDSDPEVALELRAQALEARLPALEPDPVALTQLVGPLQALPGETPAQARVLGIYVFHRVRLGAPASEIVELATRALRQADALLVAGPDGKAFSAAVHGLRWAERLDDAGRHLRAAIEHARRTGSAPCFAFASALLAEVSRRGGDLPNAEADARAALAAAEGWVAAVAAGILTAVLVDAGRASETPALLRDYSLDGTLGPSPPDTENLLVRMRSRVALRDWEPALADWEDALRRPVPGPPRASWLEHDLAAGLALRASGRQEEARRTADEALGAARSWGTDGALSEALRNAARAAAGDEAIALLHASAVHAEAAPTRLVHAHALVELGAALRRAGFRRDSRTPLRDGHAIAERCGATGLVDAARSELAASGVRVAARPQRGDDELTPSERRIAELAADGASNAEIAQALFVTVKTVEMHLTRAYRKLGIARRGELARQLPAAGDEAR